MSEDRTLVAEENAAYSSGGMVTSVDARIRADSATASTTAMTANAWIGGTGFSARPFIDDAFII